ncbi:MAG: AAA family ATPase, partial [Sphaerochaetaceae bacterium]|nr:AAA family ATPase [Sphaerochaetaceae bacterium]
MLDEITIQGYKSIQNMDAFKLMKLNVLIGENGAGKSNFISFLKTLNSLMLGQFNINGSENFVARSALFRGSDTSDKIAFSSQFGKIGYCFDIVPSSDELFFFENESICCNLGSSHDDWRRLGNSMCGKLMLPKKATDNGPDFDSIRILFDAISSWQFYHFYGSNSSLMKGPHAAESCKHLKGDGSNLGSVLLAMKDNEESRRYYKEIVDSVQLVMPSFADFILAPDSENHGTTVSINWRTNCSDCPMQQDDFSDGMLRFICLAAVFLQPDPPEMIIVDEPELGLSVKAIDILSEMIISASKKTQIIIATQFSRLISHFSCEDLVVVKKMMGASSFERLK